MNQWLLDRKTFAFESPPDHDHDHDRKIFQKNKTLFFLSQYQDLREIDLDLELGLDLVLGLVLGLVLVLVLVL